MAVFVRGVKTQDEAARIVSLHTLKPDDYA